MMLLGSLMGCAHKPLSAAALDETKLVAFIGRIEDQAGPRSNVFQNDGSYREQLKRLDAKEGDRRLGNALAVGSFEKNELTHHTISRFEVADSLRANTLALLPKQSPWTEIVHPVDVARVLESFLVQEVPANAPDYERLQALGADTVVEVVVEEYGMRSEGGKAGAYMNGFARMFRIGGSELYHRHFFWDDIKAGKEHLDPFAVRKNTELFSARIKQIVASVAAQIALDLNPADRKQPPAAPVQPRRTLPTEQVPQSDDPL